MLQCEKQPQKSLIFVYYWWRCDSSVKQGLCIHKEKHVCLLKWGRGWEARMLLGVLMNITLCAQGFLTGKWMTECSDALSLLLLAALKMVTCSQRYFFFYKTAPSCQHNMTHICTLTWSGKFKRLTVTAPSADQTMRGHPVWYVTALESIVSLMSSLSSNDILGEGYFINLWRLDTSATKRCKGKGSGLPRRWLLKFLFNSSYTLHSTACYSFTLCACLCVCVCVCVGVDVCVCVCMYSQHCILFFYFVCMYACVSMCMHACVRVCMYSQHCILFFYFVCMYVCVWVGGCTCACMTVCVWSVTTFSFAYLS